MNQPAPTGWPNFLGPVSLYSCSTLGLKQMGAESKRANYGKLHVVILRLFLVVWLCFLSGERTLPSLLKRKLIFQAWGFRCYVCLREGNVYHCFYRSWNGASDFRNFWHFDFFVLTDYLWFGGYTKNTTLSPPRNPEPKPETHKNVRFCSTNPGKESWSSCLQLLWKLG